MRISDWSSDVCSSDLERGGYGVEKFAAERGLAYDLIGAQAYAQRDYRLALDQGKSDETARRYALSLGISGQKDAAIAILDPLLREQDRAAWRDRAFILAMNGDVDEAEKIAKRSEEHTSELQSLMRISY